MISEYVDSICNEILHWKQKLGDESIRTIYFGGGTPSQIGYENMIKVINLIFENFNVENLEELSIELNPYPEAEILNFVKILNQKYKDISRLRFSFGIQSFDSEVLEKSGRNYSFGEIVDFLRDLQKLKQENNVFNFDFIAFGKFNYSKKGNKSLWDDVRLNFFSSFVNSYLADSFSLYTLELFVGSEWSNKMEGLLKEERGERDEKGEKGHGVVDLNKTNNSQSSTINSQLESEDLIYEEFEILKEIVVEAGYNRYEISNFALAGKSSIHNRVYWEMGSYVGLGVGASSYLKMERWKDATKGSPVKGKMEKLLKEGKGKNDENEKKGNGVIGLNNGNGVRWTNTNSLLEYNKGNYIDETKIIEMTEEDSLIEKFFLSLRTDKGIQDISKFEKVLVKNWNKKIDKYQVDEFLIFDGKKLKLTDTGMAVYNSLITELLENI